MGPGHKTLTVTIDPAKIEPVKAALASASDLALAALSLKALMPGMTDPIVLPRAVLENVVSHAEAYGLAIGATAEELAGAGEASDA